MKNKEKQLINILLAGVFLLPLCWTFFTSAKTSSEIYQQPPTLFPHTFSFDNYINIFTINDGVFFKYLLNSILTTGITILIVSAISLLAGYSFSKLKPKGSNIMLLFIIAALMIPFHTLLIPLYSTMSNLKLLNSRISLILIYTTFQTPFGIYMMKNAFDAIPDSLKEAAALDGASEFQTFVKVMLPANWASVATVMIYSAYTTWNDYLIAVVFANSDSIKTLNVGLTNLAVGQYGTDWGVLAAGSFVSLFPIMVLFIFLQKYFIKGMLSGALK